MPKPYTVIAILEAKPGCEDALEAALKKVVEPSRAEPACLEYRMHRSLDNPAQFIFYENWLSNEEHAEQFDKPYIVELKEKLDSLLGKPYQLYFATECE